MIDEKANAASNPTAEPVELASLIAEPRGKSAVLRSLGVIADVPVRASVVLGTTVIPVSQLSSLKEGDVLALDQAINAPVDILVEGTLVGHGQIVVVEERFGVLITGISEQ